MKKVLLLPILAIVYLVGCASSPKQIVKEDSKIEKTKSLEVEVYDFEPQEESPKEVVESTETESECSDEQVLFLVRYPFKQLQYMKDYYEGWVVINHLSQQFLELMILNRTQSIGAEEFAVKSEELGQKMTTVHAMIAQSIPVVKHIDSFTKIYFPGCQEKMEVVLKATTEDKAPNSCEYEQQLAYILDPFFLKLNLNEGIILELTLNEHLRDLHKILFEEMEKTLSTEEAVKKFGERSKLMSSEKLEERSLEMIEQIQGAYTATMDVKNSCLKEASKKDSFQKSK